MQIALIVLAWVGVAAVLFVALNRLLLRDRVRERLFDDAAAPSADASEDGVLRHWLTLAGFRSPAAVRVFLLATGFGLAAGLGGALLLGRSGFIPGATHALGHFPGGLGDLLLPFVYLAPWLWLAFCAGLPALVVRSVRRRRVTRIEEDLPLTLELLATLGEAGLGFDSGLNRILAAQSLERPLAGELQQLQVELLAGVSRVRALRRLSRRVEVLPLTLFVSALVQAEQTGSGVAQVLRTQADDLRARRREQALSSAMALPVKLLFPLVVCFLPGLFVVSLGPTFYQFVRYADTVIRGRGVVP